MARPDQDAFPVTEGASRGLRVREYFAAHAPAEPAEWFQPEMPPRPERVPYPGVVHLTNEELEQFAGIGDWKDIEECTHAVRAYHERMVASIEADARWLAKREQQRVAQWPWAWADLVLDAAKAVR